MEKRVDQRYDIPVRATLSFDNAPTQDLKTVNISAGGAFFRTNEVNQEGSEVIMTIFTESTPDEASPETAELFMSLFDDAIPFKDILAIKLKGKIVRCYNYGMAVSFDRQYCLE